MPAASSAPTEGAAAKAAARSGKRVEALSKRTEFTQVFAEPDGRLVYEASAVPQRVRHADGTWSDIDLTLAKSADGLLRPAVSAADVRFSAGGKDPLVTLVQDGKSMTLGWPLASLPAPALSADSATYAEVLPGVDLVVRATHTGFTHVLVVKNAAAAANPAVRTVNFDLGGDATTMTLPDGSLRATVGAQVLATAAAPQAWDSTTATAAKIAADKAAPAIAAEELRSSHEGPGDAAKIAPMDVEVTGKHRLVLRPDPKLLAATAKFPVFIDPEWSTGKTRWAYATNNNSNNTDTSRARVGADPDSSKIYRSFFEFPTTAIKGKHVESAYVKMNLDHSYSCTKTPTYMYQGGSIATPRTSWSTSLGQYLTSTSSNANEGSGCSDSPQPNMLVNFTGSAVTSLVHGIARKGGASVTFAFAGRASDGSGESGDSRWKKFFPADARLITVVDAVPGKPGGLQVNGVGCSSTLAIGTTTPYFSASFPDADDTQALKATWQLYKAPSGGALTAISAPAPTSVPAGKRSQSARTSTLTNNTRYAFRAYSTDPAPYNIDSVPSEYCYFTVDTSVPNISVTKVTADADTRPGKPVTFTLSSTSADVTKFNYGWTDAATSSVTPTTSGSTKTATVTLTTPKYGINQLWAQAVDSTLNKGYASTEFTALRPSPAVAHWALQSGGPVDPTAAILDQQPKPMGDNRLTITGTEWRDKGRVVGAENLAFTGNGEVTTPNFLNTTTSYSVAAWARLEDLAGFATIISQDGNGTANFQLQYRPDDVNSDGVPDKSWCFGIRPTDTSATSNFTYTCFVNSAVANRWTHVAGTYDAATKQISIWVDGVQRASAAAPTTVWASTGPLRIGNRKYSTTQYNEALRGSVADVQIFDRALVANDFTGKQASDEDSGGVDEPGILAPTHVGKWDFESMIPCYEASNETGSCDAPDVGTGWRQRINLTPGASPGAGVFSNGLSLDKTHWTGEPSDPHFQEITQERGIVQRNTGNPDSWQDSPVLKTDQSFSVSVWVQPAKLTSTMTAVAQKGTHQSPFYLQTRESTVDGVTGMRFEVMTVSADQADTEVYNHLIAPRVLTENDTKEWFNLVFVYNAASSNQLRLYVNGSLEASGPGLLWNATGPMSVGGAWWSADPGNGNWTDQWFGGIDELDVYQGAFTGGGVQVKLTEDEQVERTPPVGAWNFAEGAGTATADSSPAEANPATLTNVGWGAGRLAGTSAGTFNGTSSFGITPLKLDTSKSFTVASWARLTDKSADRTIVTRDASGSASLYFQYQKSTDRWIAQMPTATSGTVTWNDVRSVKPPKLGKWTHLATVYNSRLKTLTLYVDGVVNGTTRNVDTFNDANGATWIGRSGGTWFAGDLAEVAMWDRVVTAGEIGDLAGPTTIADWAFDETTGTVAGDSGQRGNLGTLTGGITRTTPGSAATDPGALRFNGTDAFVTAGKPLLRTDQSFTVAAWLRVTDNTHFQTAVSQDGLHSSAFQLQWGYNCKCWEFAMPNADTVNPGQVSVMEPATAALNTWTHVAGVYDAAAGTATLYVDGKQAATLAAPATPWHAVGPLTVGRTRWNDGNSDWFTGDIDDVQVYQGVLPGAGILALAKPFA
ncbi:LamG domain-containing protein [Actinoplanes sp. NPDC049668]|uniref:LamG domain-containing protein n=1 Tax=unclassified Actinoplanes TaxID=2626549 RepID=UPI0033A630B5